MCSPFTPVCRSRISTLQGSQAKHSVLNLATVKIFPVTLSAFCALEGLPRGDLIRSESESYSGVVTCAPPSPGGLCLCSIRILCDVECLGVICWGCGFNTKQGTASISSLPCTDSAPSSESSSTACRMDPWSLVKPAGAGGLLHCYTVEKLSLISLSKC